MFGTSCIDPGCAQHSFCSPMLYPAWLVYVHQCKRNDIHDRYHVYGVICLNEKCNIWLAVGGCICVTVAYFIMKVFNTIANIWIQAMVLVPCKTDVLILIKLINCSSRLHPTERISHKEKNRYPRVNDIDDTSLSASLVLKPIIWFL